MSDNLPGKRNRSRDFDKNEIMLHVDLVVKYQSVLECKKTDATTTKEKEGVWKRLAIEFNSINGDVPRSSLNLKTKFENLKKICRRKLADEKCERMKTGGGVFIPYVDPILEKLRAILSISLEGLKNPYDSAFNPPSHVQTTFVKPTREKPESSPPMPRPRPSPKNETVGLDLGLHTQDNEDSEPDEVGLHTASWDTDDCVPMQEAHASSLPKCLTINEILGDSKKSWADTLKRPVSYELLTPKKKAWLDDGKTIEIMLPVTPMDEDLCSPCESTSPSTDKAILVPEPKASQFKKSTLKGKKFPIGRPTTSTSSQRQTTTPAVLANRKFVTLAEKKIKYVQLKEDELNNEISFNRKRQALAEQSLEYDIKIKKARLHNILLKNRLLAKHMQKYH